MKWISINSYLPKHLDSVLVWGEGYNVLPAVYYDSDPDDADTPGFFVEECRPDGAQMEKKDWVSYWMPYPNPPIEIQISLRRKVVI